MSDHRGQGHSVDVLINNAGIAGPNLLEVSDFSTQRDFEQLMMQTVAELCSRLIPVCASVATVG